MQLAVKFFKTLNAPAEPAVPNAVYFVKSSIDGTVTMHVTDQDGNIESPGNPEFVLSIIDPLLVRTQTAPVLLSSTAIDLNEGTGAKQSLYTVPANRRAIITRLDIDKLSGDPTAAVFTAGWNNDADDALSEYVLSDLVDSSAKYGSLIIQPTAWPIGIAAQVLGLSVAIPQGAALTAKMNVFGYLTDTNGVPVPNIL